MKDCLPWIRSLSRCGGVMMVAFDGWNVVLAMFGRGGSGAEQFHLLTTFLAHLGLTGLLWFATGRPLDKGMPWSGWVVLGYGLVVHLAMVVGDLLTGGIQTGQVSLGLSLVGLVMVYLGLFLNGIAVVLWFSGRRLGY